MLYSTSFSPLIYPTRKGVRVMVFNGTFNNISVISWWSVLLVEKQEYPEKTTDMTRVTDELYHIMLYGIHHAWAGFDLTTLAKRKSQHKGSSNIVHTYRVFSHFRDFYWKNNTYSSSVCFYIYNQTCLKPLYNKSLSIKGSLILPINE